MKPRPFSLTRRQGRSGHYVLRKFGDPIAIIADEEPMTIIHSIADEIHPCRLCVAFGYIETRLKSRKDMRRAVMWCAKCQKHLSECTCDDLEERLDKAVEEGVFAYRYCKKCGKHYARCKCTNPHWAIKVKGKEDT